MARDLGRRCRREERASEGDAREWTRGMKQMMGCWCPVRAVGGAHTTCAGMVGVHVQWEVLKSMRHEVTIGVVQRMAV